MRVATNLLLPFKLGISSLITEPPVGAERIQQGLNLLGPGTDAKPKSHRANEASEEREGGQRLPHCQPEAGRERKRREGKINK